MNNYKKLGLILKIYKPEYQSIIYLFIILIIFTNVHDTTHQKHDFSCLNYLMKIYY